VTKRLAGRVAGNTNYASAHDLAQAMIRARKPDWQAEYMVREQSGEELPQ
jgi:hypothetical protein